MKEDPYYQYTKNSPYGVQPDNSYSAYEPVDHHYGQPSHYSHDRGNRGYSNNSGGNNYNKSSQEHTRTLCVPDWADLPEISGRVLRERMSIREEHRCSSINLSDCLMNGQQGSPELYVKGASADGVDTVIRILQSIIAKSVPEPDRCYMMYDLAHFNTINKWAVVSGDFALNYIPPNYHTGKKWIAIIPIPQDMVLTVYHWWFQKQAMELKDWCRRNTNSRCDINVELKRDSSKPHLIVYSSNKVQAMELAGKVQGLLNSL